MTTPPDPHPTEDDPTAAGPRSERPGDGEPRGDGPPGGGGPQGAPAGQEAASGRGAWVDGVRLAFGTLTVLPAGVPRRVDRVVGGRAMVLAPAVGVVVGAVAAGVVALARLVRPDAGLLAAVLGVLVVAGLSGGLHLDGLADFADALGSRRDRETMLRIMKQSDIGPFGVVAIVGVLLVDVAALTACVQAGFGWQAILIGTVASRLTLPWSCRTSIPAARLDGLGTVVAATVRPVTALLTATAVLAVAVTAAWFSPDAHITRLLGSAATVLVAIAISSVTTRRARAALGGTTGDVLGATVELALAASLLTLALTT